MLSPPDTHQSDILKGRTDVPCCYSQDMLHCQDGRVSLSRRAMAPKALSTAEILDRCNISPIWQWCNLTPGNLGGTAHAHGDLDMAIPVCSVLQNGEFNVAIWEGNGEFLSFWDVISINPVSMQEINEKAGCYHELSHQYKQTLSWYFGFWQHMFTGCNVLLMGRMWASGLFPVKGDCGLAGKHSTQGDKLWR